jgi:ribosome-associated translation inhibitor RaiA
MTMIYKADEYQLHAEIDTKQCQISGDQRIAIQPHLERLGKAVSDLSESHLWLTIVHHPQTNVHHAQAKLKVPGQTIITGEQDKSLTAATQRCLEKVLRRVENYKDNPDRGALSQAERRSQLANDIIAPVEPDGGAIGKAIVADDYRAFRHALLAQEEPLRMRVGRWVQRYPHVQAEIGRTFEIADLVEEVFLLAFERYANRPTHISVHAWLDSLIDPAIKAFWSQPDEREAASYAQSLVREKF